MIFFVGMPFDIRVYRIFIIRFDDDFRTPVISPCVFIYTYKFKFLLDPNETKKNDERSVLDSTGIRLERIYSDISKQKFYRMVNKNED